MRWYTTSRVVLQTFLLQVALTLVVRDHVECGTIGAYGRVTGPPPPQRQFSTTTFYNDTNLSSISDLYIHPITRDVYVCSFTLHIIVSIHSSSNVGKSSTVIAGLRGNGGNADGNGLVAQFSFPFGIAGDGRDTLYIGDQNNHRIRSINISNNIVVVSTLAGNGSPTNVDGDGRTASIKSPCGVALDPNRTLLYVATFSGNAVRMVNLTTKYVSTITSDTTTKLLFQRPVFVAVAPDGKSLFVSISMSRYIARIDLKTGNVTNVVANATTPFLVDDPYGVSPNGTYEPYGVLLMPDASVLIVADHTFDAVRCVKLAGTVGVGAIVTIAGNGTGGYADASLDDSSSSFMAEPSVSMLNAPQGMRWWQTGNSASTSTVPSVPLRYKMTSLTLSHPLSFTTKQE